MDLDIGRDLSYIELNSDELLELSCLVNNLLLGDLTDLSFVVGVNKEFLEKMSSMLEESFKRSPFYE